MLSSVTGAEPAVKMAPLTLRPLIGNPSAVWDPVIGKDGGAGESRFAVGGPVFWLCSSVGFLLKLWRPPFFGLSGSE